MSEHPMVAVRRADMAARLRARLVHLGAERRHLQEESDRLRHRFGDLLLEVREAKLEGSGLTITEACQLLGISKPTGYGVLDAAERRRDAGGPADDMDRADGLGA